MEQMNDESKTLTYFRALVLIQGKQITNCPAESGIRPLSPDFFECHRLASFTQTELILLKHVIIR